jgi:hypothetical protein
MYQKNKNNQRILVFFIKNQTVSGNKKGKRWFGLLHEKPRIVSQKENENYFFLLFIYYKCNQRAHIQIKPSPCLVLLQNAKSVKIPYHITITSSLWTHI